MGTILGILLWIIGRPLRGRSYLTSIGNQIDIFPLKKRWRWLGAVIFTLVVLVVGVPLVILRAPRTTDPVVNFAALGIAASWSFVGPALIWYYERYVLPSFNLHCRQLFSSNEDYRVIRKMVYTNVYDDASHVIVKYVWIILVVSAFFWCHFNGYFLKFGLRGIFDPFWWLILIGTLRFSAATAIGFCYALKSIVLARIVARSRIRRDLYTSDGMFGLSFIGDLAIKTNLFFLSGVLFFPLIVVTARRQGDSDYFPIAALVGTYIVFLATIFVMQVYSVHERLKSEKDRFLTLYAKLMSEAGQSVAEQWSEADVAKFGHYRTVMSDIQTITTWPLRIESRVRLGGRSIVVPVIVAILSAWLASAHK
ncbi:MAG: hypothetical protein ACLPN5_21430 [Roseiarcus sp.]